MYPTIIRTHVSTQHPSFCALESGQEDDDTYGCAIEELVLVTVSIWEDFPRVSSTGARAIAMSHGWGGRGSQLNFFLHAQPSCALLQHHSIT
jgi:hypothetical protein